MYKFTKLKKSKIKTTKNHQITSHKYRKMYLENVRIIILRLPQSLVIPFTFTKTIIITYKNTLNSKDQLISSLELLSNISLTIFWKHLLKSFQKKPSYSEKVCQLIQLTIKIKL